MTRPSQPPEPNETKIQKFALGGAPRPVAPQLRWRDEAGAHEVVLREATRVGSAEASGLRVEDPSVSRLHAELELRDDGVWVRDLGSRNGTFVEGVRVMHASVPDGGKLRLGAVEIAFHFEPAEAVADLWPEPRFGPLLGGSARMRRLFAYLARIAAADSPVLIQGETGTGKELVANAIHDASPRAKKPLVIVDCAALPENLIESELFGHAKGAFTGAVGTRVGAIEAADGGTVFLDEIGELPLNVQPRLLRVIESGTIRRVGETARRDVDVRFVCATHRDLAYMVNAGAFREDLYFRLAVLPVTVPPLRERPEDIPALVASFLKNDRAVSPEVLRQLQKRPWLGNVRELRNFVMRAVAVGTEEALSMGGTPPAAAHATRPPAASSPGDVASSTPPPAATPASGPAASVSAAAVPRGDVTFEGDYKTFRARWLEHGEREYVRDLLARHQRNVAAAAKEADLDRTYLYRLIRRHNL